MKRSVPAAVRLLDEDVSLQREAAEEVETHTLAGRSTLRQALLSDEDAEVRATAARRLGDSRDARMAGALLAALRDPLPSVRDCAWRALARLGTEEVLPLAARAVDEEEVWWVRRSAVRAAASLGPDAVELLVQALQDPFWRVRYAAAEALVLLGSVDARLRQHVREAISRAPEESPAGAAGRWLEAAWAEGATGLEGAPLPAPLAAPHADVSLVGDEDPAVVTARLARGAASAVDVNALVELLGNSSRATARSGS